MPGADDRYSDRPISPLFLPPDCQHAVHEPFRRAVNRAFDYARVLPLIVRSEPICPRVFSDGAGPALTVFSRPMMFRSTMTLPVSILPALGPALDCARPGVGKAACTVRHAIQQALSTPWLGRHSWLRRRGNAMALSTRVGHQSRSIVSLGPCESRRSIPAADGLAARWLRPMGRWDAPVMEECPCGRRHAVLLCYVLAGFNAAARHRFK